MHRFKPNDLDKHPGDPDEPMPEDCWTFYTLVTYADGKEPKTERFVHDIGPREGMEHLLNATFQTDVNIQNGRPVASQEPMAGPTQAEDLPPWREGRGFKPDADVVPW